jgi:5-oxoprolinase (ATP-hydrolysing) subunit A
MTRIDLNADMGESAEALTNGHDEELMRYITSANVACGAHAGNDETMRLTLELAKKNGVAVGAHPSYPDRENFGRFEVVMEPEELEISLGYQLSRLRRIADQVGVKIRHVKPHGALYHAASRDPRTAQVIADVVREFAVDLIIIAQAGSMALRHWETLGLSTAREAFADRAYESNGELRKRSLPGALLNTPEDAAQQALEIVLNRRVRTVNGPAVQVEADTLCVHSDTPGAAGIAREIRHVLTAAGVKVIGLGAR